MLGALPSFTSLDPIIWLAIFIPILAIVIPIHAAILRAVTSWTTKVRLTFRTACILALVTIVINGLVNFLIISALTPDAKSDASMKLLANIIAATLIIAICFVVNAVIYGNFIAVPGTQDSIGFAKGCLISLILLVIGLAIGFAIYLPLRLFGVLV